MFLSGVFTTWTWSPGSVQKESLPTCILQDILLQVYEAGKSRSSDRCSTGFHMTMQQCAFAFTPEVPGLSESDLLLLLVRRPAMVAANYARTQIKHYVSTPAFSGYSPLQIVVLYRLQNSGTFRPQFDLKRIWIRR